MCRRQKQTGRLSKVDLVSEMVGEFPELQGTMGYHYALRQGFENDIAMGIRGQYLPRFAEDILPMSPYGCVVSLADRLDKLGGIFGIDMPPSGEKDPFALRRAALGLIKIIIEKHLKLDIKALIQCAVELYDKKLVNHQTTDEVYAFIMERLKYWYLSKGVKVERFNAVMEKNISELTDFDLRLNAVQSFADLEAAGFLSEANKRVTNLLIKEKLNTQDLILNPELLQESAEKQLACDVLEKEKTVLPLIQQRQYTEVLKELVTLKDPVDKFFAEVMVMDKNEQLKNNRLALLNSLRNLFFQVADISKLCG